MMRDLQNNASSSASERAAAVSASSSAVRVNDPLNTLMAWPSASDAIADHGVPTAAAGGTIGSDRMPPSHNPLTNTSHPSLASQVGGGGNNNKNTSSHPSLASLSSTPSTAAQPSSSSKVRTHCATLTSAMMTPSHLSPDAINCATCGFAGSDLRIKGCERGCAYHARCIDLVGLCNAAHQQAHSQQRQGHSGDGNIVIAVCPNCNGTANGLEIIPLSFGELDRSQRVGMGKKGFTSAVSGGMTGASNTNGGRGGSGGSNNDESMGEGMSRKRSSNDLDPSNTGGGSASVSYPSNIALACRATNVTSTSSTALNQNNNLSTSQCYDPAIPRTGRWTDEELAFRDAIIAHFLDGSLPLSNGLKLNDFLSNMLKSKQSRLTKKMKHAKLSTKYFRIKSGYLSPIQNSKDFSSLEYSFVNVIADPIERSEIQFHMQKEWRDHLAERCTYLRIQFDADEWLKSVDFMDRRVALEMNRSRMVKRRCLMGKAMETDVSASLPGVFINQVVDRRSEDFLLDMEAKSRKVTTHSPALLGNTGGNGSSIGVGGNGGGGEVEDGDFGRFLMSMLDEAPVTMNHVSGGTYPQGAFGHGVGQPSSHPSHTGHAAKKATIRSSYCDPNFRYAAPFLAGITSYMERNSVPFEHVDIWVPSTIPLALENEGQGTLGSAPMIGEMGSGRSGTNLMGMGENDGNGGVCRLCFAGSATLSVQIVDEPAPADVSSMSTDEKKNEMTKKIAPLTGDEIFNFSLFGVYSKKFSFASGCGLPGRVFKSGVTAWEQFLPNAPPEMFERRDGAIQFGINTALGFSIDSPNVGRIVVVLYSKHNREKDEDLVNRMVKDVRLFNPCPRWKLVVDVRSNATISGNGNAASTKHTNTTRNRTPKRDQSPHDILLEDFLKKKIKRHDDKEKARQESENDYNAKKVRLAKQFRAMTSALNGDKLRAAKVCPDFEIFLSTDEKVELATL